MPRTWNSYFTPEAKKYIERGIALALEEDGPELTSRGIFNTDDWLCGIIRAKKETIVAGLPLVGIVMKAIGAPFSWKPLTSEGARVAAMTDIASVLAPAEALLKGERVILNYITHLSGVATLTSRYVEKLAGTHSRLLDTRKTTPGMRHLEKYATQLAGCINHRMDLAEMLMLKDNHIDAAGSIQKAVARLREQYNPCPPIEVECRNSDDVAAALEAGADRIMLDNMTGEKLARALEVIPANVEAEISGGVTLDNIRSLAMTGKRPADFISVGRLTHSAKAADLSMRVEKAPAINIKYKMAGLGYERYSGQNYRIKKEAGR